MNKGFTLIELMAVIILLGVLSLIATVTVNNTLSKNKTEACEMQKENVISSAKIWANKNAFSLPSEDGKSITITLKQLKDDGFVDSDIKNPKNDELLSDDMEIIITRVDNNYKYELEMEC